MRACFTGLGLRLGAGPAVDSAACSSATSSPCSPRRARFRCTSAAAPGGGTRPATSSRPSCRNEAVAALPGGGRRRLGRASGPHRSACPGAVFFRSERARPRAAADRPDRIPGDRRRSSQPRRSPPAAATARGRAGPAPLRRPCNMSRRRRRAGRDAAAASCRSIGCRPPRRRRARCRRQFGWRSAARARASLLLAATAAWLVAVSRVSSASRGRRPARRRPPPRSPPLEPRLDRLQLTSWALLRSQQTSVAGSPSLASGGQLGASQAGVRLVYNFARLMAAGSHQLGGRPARRRSRRAAFESSRSPASRSG